MSDIIAGDINPLTPPCPVCGSATELAQDIHKAVAKVTDIFRCKSCKVEYPVPRKRTL